MQTVSKNKLITFTAGWINSTHNHMVKFISFQNSKTWKKNLTELSFELSEASSWKESDF
jgi:hypothetical protein